ncbi:MAG TPA: hypothetical protein VKQ28_16725 [Candidatus Acidoferrum sp.]|nr:hypothetical protein [Candidatus Acidoferrum sp.]
MVEASITGRQMKRLQTLWGLFAREAHLEAKDREARIGWVAGAVGRQIASFKELTAKEAAAAIEAVQKHLPPELLKRASRRTAQAYGTAGRKRGGDREVRMADAGTLQLLANLCTALGWTRERLDAFLRSPKSPVRSGAIRTLAEANRVIWVLKSLQRRKIKERTDGYQPSANPF